MSKKTPADNDDMVELRRLILGNELTKLDQINSRLENSEKFSTDVSKVLPLAMQKSANQDDQLSQAMVPTVEEILRLSIKRDINKFASALFPVIGPAIRKSIAETIRQMLQSLNQVLEHGLSWQGLMWRIESFRTNIPFAQIVMLNSLEYRVEQVFLIHRETGILLNHVEQEDKLSQNVDMVSSMLTAIGDFVGDSFDVDNRQQLDSIQVGDFSIFIEQGPEAILAVACRGNAPVSLRNTMRECMEEIQAAHQDQLEKFKGDTTPFEACRKPLLRCLVQAPQKNKTKKLSLRARLIWIVIIILFFYLITSRVFLSIQQHKYINLLQDEPGYILTQVDYQSEQLKVKGLKDPLARDPIKFLANTTLNPDDLQLQFNPYQSLEKPFVEKRIKKVLKLPENTAMHFEQGVLKISGFASEDKINTFKLIAPLIAGVDQLDINDLKSSIDLSSLNAPDSIRFSVDVNTGQLSSAGSASTEWKIFARQQATRIDGINSYNDTKLEDMFDLSVIQAPDSVTMTLKDKQLTISGEADTDWIKSLHFIPDKYDEISTVDISQLKNSDEKRLQSASHLLQQKIIFFDAALSFNFNANETFQEVSRLVKTIIETSTKLNQPTRIIIKGHTDSIGKFQDNVFLSRERADYVAQYLFNMGISPKYIEIKGQDAPAKKEKSIDEQRYNRRVTFLVQH